LFLWINLNKKIIFHSKYKLWTLFECLSQFFFTFIRIFFWKNFTDKKICDNSSFPFFRGVDLKCVFIAINPLNFLRFWQKKLKRCKIQIIIFHWKSVKYFFQRKIIISLNWISEKNIKYMFFQRILIFYLNSRTFSEQKARAFSFGEGGQIPSPPSTDLRWSD
jgi:hypothetical protein